MNVEYAKNVQRKVVKNGQPKLNDRIAVVIVISAVRGRKYWFNERRFDSIPF